MVVHDEAEVRVNSHGDEDAALQHPLPTERGGGGTWHWGSARARSRSLFTPTCGSGASATPGDQHWEEALGFPECLLTTSLGPSTAYGSDNLPLLLQAPNRDKHWMKATSLSH